MSDHIDAKATEIVSTLAKDTGVSPEDVEKVLVHLGLRSALANRLNVDAKMIRLATGQKHE